MCIRFKDYIQYNCFQLLYMNYTNHYFNHYTDIDYIIRIIPHFSQHVSGFAVNDTSDSHLQLLNTENNRCYNKKDPSHVFVRLSHRK